MIYNLIQFLLPLKVRSPLLYLFYILAMIMTIFRIIELFYFVLTPHTRKLNLTIGCMLGQNIADGTATVANVALGCLFVATMYDISYSIKILNNPAVNMSQADRHKKFVYAVAIIFTIIFGICLALSNNRIEMRRTYNFCCLIVAYFILSIVYTWTLIQLRKAMKTLLVD